LQEVVGEGKITDGSHDNEVIVRTATISQKSKLMTLTFHRNISTQNVMISVEFELDGTRSLVVMQTKI
jgi:hypothetical protein